MDKQLKNFYIPEEQSVYLLSANDAKKLRDWVDLCIKELTQLGFSDVSLIGQGAYGFVFSGLKETGQHQVFKFSRITLPLSVREKLEEEAFMLKQLSHPNIPSYIDFVAIKKQSILVMERGPGLDLHQMLIKFGRPSIQTVINITVQLARLLKYLRNVSVIEANGQTVKRPIVHGDIKPSNLIWHDETETLSLVDFGSSVFAQIDEHRQPVVNNVMDLMSNDVNTSNLKLGDVYFIGEEQISGELSSPRFDEQGAAATIYALASNQSCRFGRNAIPPSSLGLPKLLAITLDNMLSNEPLVRDKAGDVFIAHAEQMLSWQCNEWPTQEQDCCLPIWSKSEQKDLDTVVYSSRKSFLRQQGESHHLSGVNDAQLDKYYKNYLQGMGENEKAFVAAVSRLGDYPVVGGLAIHWQAEQLEIDSNLSLFDNAYKDSFYQTINNMVDLARSLKIENGTFKACLFDAKSTLHFERVSEDQSFDYDGQTISFEITDTPEIERGKQHSYFEDGDDPDEKLQLPDVIMEHIVALNDIHHTGCIIFEVLPTHLKVHNYYHLLDSSKYVEFKTHLKAMLKHINLIKGLGVSGFMKLPYKDAKHFDYQTSRPELYTSQRF